MNIPPPAISSTGLRKAFGSTLAVDGVDLSIAAGAAHALLGENGAGKSTVVKLFSGLLRPDGGTIEIGGRAVRIDSPRAAQALGVQTAFQEMTLVRDLSVLENMLLPRAPLTAAGTIARRSARQTVEAHLAALSLQGIDPDAEIRDLDLPERQKIEIARALYRRPSILLLDEPTSTLTGRDVDWLGDIIAAERARGTTVVFISHRLREVRAFCDTLTVLRNGRNVVSGPVSGFDDEELIRQIVGRSIGKSFPPRPATRADAGARPVVFECRNLSAGRARGVTFQLRRGEILGVAGLQGMGQLDLVLACYGMAEVTGGGLAVDGRPVVITSPTDAVRARVGLSLLPEDRKTEALILGLTGLANASLPVIGRFARRGLIDEAAERQDVAAAFDRVDVDRRAIFTRAGAFSGGNQQKIAIAKWLLAGSRMLILYDPTRGIDVGTKHELYRLMHDYATAGGAILFYSTEIPELIHLADRVLVMYQGRVAEEVSGADLTEEHILATALGGAPRVLSA